MWSSSSRRARSPRSTASPSSATARYSPSQLRDVISTSQSGWLDILKSAAFYDPERIEQRQGAAAPPLPQERLPRRARARGRGRQERRGHRLRHHLHRRGGRALHLRRRHHQHQAARRRHRGAASPRVAVKPGSTYNQETVDKSVERADAGAQRPGPGLRPGQGRPEARRRRPHHRHRLPRRAGPAHPRRAHRHRRQQEDQGLRHPARVPDRRGRPRQRLHDRARAQARAGAGLLQERGRHSTRRARRRTRWSSPSRWSRTSPTTCRSASATRWPRASSATSRSPSATSSATASGCASSSPAA